MRKFGQTHTHTKFCTTLHNAQASTQSTTNIHHAVVLIIVSWMNSQQLDEQFMSRRLGRLQRTSDPLLAPINKKKTHQGPGSLWRVRGKIWPIASMRLLVALHTLMIGWRSPGKSWQGRGEVCNNHTFHHMAHCCSVCCYMRNESSLNDWLQWDCSLVLLQMMGSSW